MKLLFVFLFVAQVCQAVPRETAKNSLDQRFQPIIMGALGGTVVGLSTLPFYGRPQERLGNVFYGLALGLFIGTGYSIVHAAQRDFNKYGEQEVPERDAYDKGLQIFSYNFSF